MKSKHHRYGREDLDYGLDQRRFRWRINKNVALAHALSFVLATLCLPNGVATASSDHVSGPEHHSDVRGDISSGWLFGYNLGSTWEVKFDPDEIATHGSEPTSTLGHPDPRCLVERPIETALVAGASRFERIRLSGNRVPPYTDPHTIRCMLTRIEVAVTLESATDALQVADYYEQFLVVKYESAENRIDRNENIPENRRLAKDWAQKMSRASGTRYRAFFSLESEGLVPLREKLAQIKASGVSNCPQDLVEMSPLEEMYSIVERQEIEQLQMRLEAMKQPHIVSVHLFGPPVFTDPERSTPSEVSLTMTLDAVGLDLLRRSEDCFHRFRGL